MTRVVTRVGVTHRVAPTNPGPHSLPSPRTPTSVVPCAVSPRKTSHDRPGDQTGTQGFWTRRRDGRRQSTVGQGRPTGRLRDALGHEGLGVVPLTALVDVYTVPLPVPTDDRWRVVYETRCPRSRHTDVTPTRSSTSTGPTKTPVTSPTPSQSLRDTTDPSDDG